MKSKNGFYSVIKHVPLPSSRQAQIIGVVLLCSDYNYVGALFAMEGIRMLTGLLNPSANADPSETNAMEQAHFAPSIPTVFRSLTQLKEFLSELGGEIQLSHPTRVQVVDPAADMEQILDKVTLCQTPEIPIRPVSAL
jgi:hypothetical protein